MRNETNKYTVSKRHAALFIVTVTYGLKSLRETRKKSVTDTEGPNQYLRTK
jgi:hypothetical protein